MLTEAENAKEHENACARVATQFTKPWLRGYVRGKLRRDRIYQAAYELMGDSTEPILDVGCGVGLLAFYLRERACAQQVIGLDLDSRKIAYGAEIASRSYEDVDLRFHDVGQAVPNFSGNVVLFDVLHYLPPPAQRALLRRLAKRVAPGGFLIIRDCPREPRLRYCMTWMAEKMAQAITWNIGAALHFPSRASIDDVFEPSEFERESRPLWGASPFNNYLFIFRRHAAAVVPASGGRSGNPVRPGRPELARDNAG
jgi:2-polyprenyl-3-methyl-5-hydroxy-6-metoxy-1,4-benzoquinol methylase